MKKNFRFVAVAYALGLAVMASCGGDDVHHLADAPPAPDTPAGMSMLSIDRADMSFGTIMVGATSPATTFTITNSGDAVSGMPMAALSGADAGEFAVGSNTCTAPLPPAATCSVEVRFAPTSSGAKSATFAVAATPGGMVTSALDGEGIGLGSLTLTSTQSALGTVVVGDTGTIVSTFTATNTGTGTTGTLSVIPSGSDAADFSKSMDMCSGTTLAPAASCTFQVRLAPQRGGSKGAQFHVTGAPGGNVSGAVTGTALAPASLRAVPLQVELGSIAVGAASPAITVTIANLGDQSTGMLTQTVTGGGFSATGGTCSGATLAGHTTCTVQIELRPTTSGAKTGTLTIAGAPGGTVVTTLVGTGVAANGLTITPSAKQFATTNVGASSAPQQFTVTNNGAAATGALAVTLGGSAAGEYQLVAGGDTCTGTALAAAATCTVSVVFSPSVLGVAHGAVTVAGSPGGAVTAGLLGVAAGEALLAITPEVRGFGSVTLGSMSSVQTFTITNLGGQVSGIPAATLTGAGAGQFAIAGNTCTATLAPGMSCTVQVRFAPTAAGAATASLSVAATPGGTITAALSGDGMATGGIVIMPSSSTFPATAIGDTSIAQTLTVLNTGSAATSTITVTSSSTEVAATNNCTTLAEGATCTITVTFSPTALGARSGTITASATTGGTATAALGGQGIPRLEIIALESGPVVDPANFGTSIVNNSTPNDVLVLVRNNTATAKTFGVTPAFGSPAQYAVVSNTCGATIGGAGGLCTVGVRFAPTTAGAKTGSIAFDIGAGATNRAVQNLTGMGVEALQITALDGTDFGSIPVNTSAPNPLRFRVTNPAGSQTSGALAIALAGGTAFSLGTDGCSGQTLTAGESCIVEVEFAPTAVAAAMTTLTATAAPGGMPFINIDGAGVAPTGSVPTDITLSPSSIAEDAPAGSTVGTLSTTDADAGNTFVYALVSGTGSTDNAAFTISGALVRTAGVLDFEIKPSYSIRVRVTDSGGNIFEKALTITVTNVDELPTAVDDAAMVDEDAAATAIPVLANDSDPDGGPKTITSVTQPAHGTVAITGGGTGVTYRPAANYAGADSFTYTLNGGSLGTVTVTVTPVDDPPTAVADSFMVNEDSPAGALAVLANDTDIDAGPITINSVIPAANGTVVITGGGSGLTYAPHPNYTGSDTFSYTLNGGSTAVVTITVTPSDDNPLAIDDAATLLEDAAPRFIDVVMNDTDPDGGPVMVTSFTQPAHGTVMMSMTGVTYTVAADYNGTDSFTYTLNGGSVGTVNLTITPVNDAPSFTAGANQSVNEDAGAQTVAAWATMLTKGPTNESAQVLDFLVSNNNMTLFSTQPAISATGQLTYTPAANANGMATVTVRLHDNGGTADMGVDTSAPQTFTITVAAVDDPPVAAAISQTIMEDTATQVTLSYSDLEGHQATSCTTSALDDLVVTTACACTSGTCRVSVRGTPTNFNGAASFAYTVTANSLTSASATASITVSPVDDPPVAAAITPTINEDVATQVTLSYSDPEGHQATSCSTSMPTNLTVTTACACASGTCTVGVRGSPTNFNGAASFMYTVTANTLTSSSATASVTVSAVDDPPVAAAISQTINEDTATQVTLSYSDPEGHQATSCSVTPTSLTVTTACACASGTCTVGVRGSPTNFNGAASFTYTVTANSLTSAAATASITVSPVDDPPVAAAISPAINEDVATQVTLSYSDPEGHQAASCSTSMPTNLTVTTACACTSGTCTVGVRGSPTNFNGAASFTYTVTANSLTSNSATASVTVSAVNDAPVASAISATIAEDTPTQVTLSYSDVDGDLATSCATSSPTNLTVTTACACASGTCTVGVRGTSNFNGAASFAYTVTANGQTSGSVAASITVTEVNDAPTTMANTFGPVLEDSAALPISFSSVTGNDSPGPNEAGQTLTVTGVTAGTGGTVFIANGAIQFVPAADFHGTATFTYTVQDNGTTNGASDPRSATGSVSVTVTSVDDRPDAKTDSVTTNEDTTIIIDVLANDLGLGDGGLVVTFTGPSHGTAFVDAQNRIVYTPAPNVTTTASLSYTVKDADGDQDGDRVAIFITPRPDAPIANPDTGMVSTNKQVTINLLANDSDPDGDMIAYDRITVPPENGTIIEEQGGFVTYKPNFNFCSPNGDKFEYQIKDATGRTAVASVRITFFPCQ